MCRANGEAKDFLWNFCAEAKNFSQKKRDPAKAKSRFLDLQ